MESSMDRLTVDWHGQGTAIITPFSKAGEIDEPALRRQVNFLIAQGVNFIVANGCTGEFWAQTMEERKRVVHIIVEAAAGRVPVIGGSSANSTPEVIEYSRYHREIGCSGVMIMPPFLVRPNKEDIFHHYKAVSDTVEIPILLYNIPRDTVNDLTPDLVDRLADLPTVVAIKDSTFDFNIFYQLQTLVGDRIRVLIGPSTMFGHAALELGADGWVDTYSNLWPALTIDLYNASKSGDLTRAKEIQAKAAEFRRWLSGSDRNMYCAVKAAMNILGLPGGYPRLPLRPLAEPHISEIRNGLDRFGVPGADKTMAAE
jgi:4-hydroxy-tetrahydrodipicolinate synthase